MQIKKNKKKQELEHDPVIDGLAKSGSFVQENRNTVIAGAAIILLLIVGLWAFRYFRESAIREAQADFGKAMVKYEARNVTGAIEGFNQVLDAHDGTPFGAYAAYMLGSIYMQQQDWDQAIGYLETAASKKRGTGFVPGEALENIAVAYEYKEDRESALEYYRKALQDPELDYRYASIRWKMALLNRELGRKDQAIELSQEIVKADTLAGEYKQKAEQLLAELSVL